MRRKRTVHRIRSPKIREKLRLAAAPDIHSAPFDDMLEDFSACDFVNRISHKGIAERRFSGTVWSHQNVCFALTNLYIKVIEDLFSVFKTCV